MKNEKNAKAILEDFEELPPRGPGSRPSAAEAAMYIEDCFGLLLSDEEIGALEGADPEAVGRLIAAKGRP